MPGLRTASTCREPARSRRRTRGPRHALSARRFAGTYCIRRVRVTALLSATCTRNHHEQRFEEGGRQVDGHDAGRHAPERAKFKGLLLANPNYFGNLAESPFKAVLPVSGNTYYEELACLGFQPQQERLEAVVYIYQPSGYGTDVCGVGSSEYVRFYLSFDNGASWQDQGMTSFQAHDIPQGTDGGKRLEYAASLPVNPTSKLCFENPLILVRRSCRGTTRRRRTHRAGRRSGATCATRRSWSSRAASSFRSNCSMPSRPSRRSI